MRNVFIETDNVVRFEKMLESLGDTEKGMPGLALAYGQAGRGKTECSRHFAVQSGAIYFRVLEGLRPRAFLSRLLREVNSLNPPSSVDGCKEMLIKTLDREPQTLLIDEADRLRDIALIEHLRDIHDETGSPVVLIGEQQLYAIMSSRDRIWSRVTHIVEFGAVTNQDIVVFGVRAADLKISGPAAQRINQRANGDFRYVFHDIRDLEVLCKANGTNVVSVDLIERLPVRKAAPNATKKMDKKNTRRSVCEADAASV